MNRLDNAQSDPYNEDPTLGGEIAEESSQNNNQEYTDQKNEAAWA